MYVVVMVDCQVIRLVITVLRLLGSWRNRRGCGHEGLRFEITTDDNDVLLVGRKIPTLLLLNKYTLDRHHWRLEAPERTLTTSPGVSGTGTE